MKKVELTIEQAEFVLDVARRFENFIQIALFIEPEWRKDLSVINVAPMIDFLVYKIQKAKDEDK
mgnify:CR=1 FL=1